MQVFHAIKGLSFLYAYKCIRKHTELHKDYVTPWQHNSQTMLEVLRWYLVVMSSVSNPDSIYMYIDNQDQIMYKWVLQMMFWK